MFKNKFLSFWLAGLTLLSGIAPAHAAIDTPGGSNDVPTVVTAEQSRFSVTVPASLPITVSNKGVVTVADNCQIVNNAAGPVLVKGVSVQAANSWSLEDYNTDFGKRKVNEKKFGMMLQDSEVQTDGSCGLGGFSTINGGQSAPLTYNANVAVQTKAIQAQTIANVVFTMGWDAVSGGGGGSFVPSPIAPKEMDKAKMDAALKSLTGKITFAKAAYPGAGGVDISAAQDGSVMAVVSGQDATVYSEGGIYGIDTEGENAVTGMFAQYGAKSYDFAGLDTSNMTNMTAMFAQSYATSLDLSSFDTSKVTSMRAMFFGATHLTSLNLSGFETSSVTNMMQMFSSTSMHSIDLSSFDTSKVENMSYMFHSTLFDELDLSGFDLTQVTDTKYMFDTASVKTCYCRTQEDCEKLKSPLSCSGSINFVVKS